jgi:pimeloyl-ACP methyl ester carboxylesterase
MIDVRTVQVTSGIKASIACRTIGDGPPVLLLHGWATSWYLWDSTMQALAAAGFRVYAPDHIGCGESSKPFSAYTPSDLARYVEGLRAALEVDRFTLVGHSLGGHMALNYALAHPEHVERLVLVDPAYAPLRQIKLSRAQLLLGLIGIPLLGELALMLMPARILRWAIRQPWGGFYKPERLPAEFLDRTAIDYLGKASPLVSNTVTYLVLFSLPGLSRLKRDADLRPRAGEIAMPSIVFWGEHDTLLSPSSFSRLAAAMPTAVAWPLRDAGHIPPVESPYTFNPALVAFLKH